MRTCGTSGWGCRSGSSAIDIVAHGGPSMGIRRSVPLVLAYVLLSAAPALAQVCFRPRPLATCRSTLITEFAVGTRMPSNGPSGRDRYVSTKFGWMANVAAHSAVGGAFQFGIDDEEDARLAFKPRYRHWLTDATSVDLAAGVLLSGKNLRSPGFTGHVALLQSPQEKFRRTSPSRSASSIRRRGWVWSGTRVLQRISARVPWHPKGTAFTFP